MGNERCSESECDEKIKRNVEWSKAEKTTTRARLIWMV